mmetsp:Transcript_47189/g.119432  ORF Transcript_47189/g.119432 Transcript_47189/m.119432 type:complete len:495 (+) Transcript_47189:107-1591(+)
MMHEEDDDMVVDMVHLIQLHVMPRRVRCREFFNDFDPLRSGRCSEANFARALGNLGMRFTEDETKMLATHFTQYGPKVSKPSVVNYMHFCAEVDKIFADEETHENMKSMMMTSSPGSTVMSTFIPNTMEDEEHFMHVLHRVAVLCKAKGVVIKPLYTDLDRSAVPSPSMLNSRRGGKVTRDQFKRNWPFKKEMNPEDLELLCDRYATPAGDVHFMALHNEVSEVLPEPAQPFPTSPLHLRPDSTEWAHQEVSVVQRIQAKVVEKRMRLKEHFQDFDALRKGLCTPGQVKAVFTILNLSREIDRNDFETLLSLYMQDDGLFNYQAFVLDVDRAFTTPGLERDPLAMTEMPGSEQTSLARRNPMRLSPSKQAKIGKLEDRIRTFIRKRRVLMKPMFQDFDKCHRGYVTRNQFSRIMSMMNIELDEKAVGYLCNTYCDLGNHNDFNWKRFMIAVDPPAEDVETAMLEMTSPFIAFRPKSYFNDRGRVLGKTMSMPML